jgi:hypothetical protein
MILALSLLDQSAIETYNNILTVQSESSVVKLTRFQIEGWLELIGTPSVDILHQSDCAQSSIWQHFVHYLVGYSHMVKIKHYHTGLLSYSMFQIPD